MIRPEQNSGFDLDYQKLYDSLNIYCDLLEDKIHKLQKENEELREDVDFLATYCNLNLIDFDQYEQHYDEIIKRWHEREGHKTKGGKK